MNNLKSLSLTIAVLVSACATPRSARFTSAADLQKVLALPKPSGVFHETKASPPSWELVGTLPTGYSEQPHETASLFSATLIAGSKSGFRPSQALACVAHQCSRFVALNGEAPPRQLKSFIEARCGVAEPGVRIHWLKGKVPAQASDAEVAKNWASDVSKLIEGIPSNSRAGIGQWREGENLVVMVASVGEETTVETAEMVPGPDGFVWIRGSTRKAATSIFGDVNQGPRGSAHCVNTEARAAPSFEIKCPVLKADEAAWISIGARERGRILGFQILRILALPSGGPATTFKDPALVVQRPGLSAEDFLHQLNQVRAQAGAPELSLSPAQSEHQRQLAPFYFDAETKNDAAQADRIALGVMAGWRVETEIMRGGFGASFIGASTASELLSDVLESPVYRRDLLSPQARILAIGLFEDQGAIAGLFSTYQTPQTPKWPDTANTLLTELNGRRGRNGKAPTQWVLMPSSLEATLADGVAGGQYDSDDALGRLMRQAAEVTGRRVRGWRITAFDLDDFDWPQELLSKDSVEVMISVTTERVPSEPWRQYVVMVVVLEGVAQPST